MREAPRADAGDAGSAVLIFAPVGRDADLTRRLLERASIPCSTYESIGALCHRFAQHGGGAVLLTEEALDDPELPLLTTTLDEQPAWSDVPVMLFAGGPGADATLRTIRSIETLRNVTLLERPIRVAAVISSARAALRGRARQYELRDLLLALHAARSEAESANRLKDEFLATLSHELRTPLNAILGWTSMLARGQIEASRLPRVFDALNRNAESQAQIIGDVLDVSRIITGKLQLHMTAVDVCDIVARAIDAIRPGAAAKNVSVSVSDAPSCLVLGDADRLQQVFWNLLTNALKFTPSGGAVRVEIERDHGAISVSVADTGAGIPPSFLPFVFERFRQADQTTTRLHGGLGLGLSIVKHLIDLHGGSVTAYSDGPNKGARFCVRFPAVEQATTAAVLQDDRDEHADLRGMVILVVDDDESTREVVGAALQSANAEVRQAASAAEARRWLDETRIDLVVADLGMPLEDGFAFIRRLRESRLYAVPAIALSAYADAASKDAAVKAGFTAYLAKPARPSALIDLAGSLLGLLPARDR